MEDGASGNPLQNQPATRQADIVSEERRTLTISSHTWIGPLPDPAAMERYESLVPGAAERFLGLLEGEVAHRQVMDNRNSRRRDWGLALAFVVVLLVVAAGAGLIFLGYGWAAAAVIGINVVGLAAVFITGGIRGRQASHRPDNSDERLHHQN